MGGTLLGGYSIRSGVIRESFGEEVIHEINPEDEKEPMM